MPIIQSLSWAALLTIVLGQIFVWRVRVFDQQAEDGDNEMVEVFLLMVVLLVASYLIGLAVGLAVGLGAWSLAVGFGYVVIITLAAIAGFWALHIWDRLVRRVRASETAS
ncbi:MAG: hypothetical protein HY918_03740 [Candidatus Doudnabacteria bacterium]|nr:hypothetical protein [Candidatus Doudnabacteria bacterium]